MRSGEIWSMSLQTPSSPRNLASPLVTELISFSVRDGKDKKYLRPQWSKAKKNITKSEKALSQAVFPENTVISFSVLRAKSVTVVDTISTTVIFYLFPFWGCFWKETRNISNIFGHKQIVCPDLMRPRSEKTRLCKMTIVIRI